MAYIICEPCVDVMDTACVDVCPVDCIHTSEDETQLYIDPDVCIDCAACEPCLLYTSPSPRDRTRSRMPSSA